jgi:hypothetical protein
MLIQTLSRNSYARRSRSHEVTSSILLISFLSLVAAFTFFGCSSSLELSSGWTTQTLKIDGSGSGLNEATTNIPGPEVLVGIKNDKDNLYICMITSNRMTQMQMLALGSTVWINAEGRKDKTFGVRFPVAGLLQGHRFPARENQDDLNRLVDVAQRQIEIIGPETDAIRRLQIQEGKGVEARLGYANETLTCELKVPLHKSDAHPYAVNSDQANTISIGLETGPFSAAMMGQPGGSSPSMNARSGGRTGGRGGGGSPGGAGGLGGDAPEPLKHWLVVHLAGGEGGSGNK